MGSGGGGTVGELVPSLLIAPWRKELLMLAGDVECNPGPFTQYGENSCDINLGPIVVNVIMHNVIIPILSGEVQTLLVTFSIKRVYGVKVKVATLV